MMKPVEQRLRVGDDPSDVVIEQLEPTDKPVGVSLIRASDLKPEPIRWLWDNWLARGKLHMLAGAPGTGKTTIALALAATVTVGGRWPDGARCEPGNVLIWSGEDDPKDTLLPRLLAAGADLARIFFVGDVRTDDDETRSFDPARDMQALRVKAEHIGDVCLLIVDPVVNAVAGDSHKNGEVRRALQPLVDLAAKLDVAVAGISHFSKSTAGRDPIERVTGSIAFGALPRVVMATAKMENDGKEGRLFARAKSNIGPDGGGFDYTIEQVELVDHPGLSASRVLWGKPLQGSARDLLAVADASGDPEARGALTETADWLHGLLSDEGEMDKCEVMKLARADGLAERTIHRAREKLGIQVRTSGFGKDKRSCWRLPENPICANRAKNSTLQKPGTNGTNEVAPEGNEHLRKSWELDL